MFDIHVTDWAVFGDSSPVECIERTAAVGADGVELFNWEDTDIETIADAADESDVSVVSTGALGVAANVGHEGPSITNPDHCEEAIADIERSLDAVMPLDTNILVITVGPARPTLSRATQYNAIVNVLRNAAPAATEHDVTLVIEPLNTRVDHPDYFLTTASEGVKIVKAVDHPNVKLLYDIYHQQITEGNLIETIREHHEHIGMYHLADVPGRHEPGTGEINYRAVLQAIADTGYEGSVGLEYIPMDDPEATVRDVLELRDALGT